MSAHPGGRFRNYMHHIAGSIEEWVQEEEAKYQADLLAKEVERHAKEIAEKEAAAEREAAATRESQIYTIILSQFCGK